MIFRELRFLVQKDNLASVLNIPLYKLRRNKIYSSCIESQSITDLNDFHPFLYDFDPKKRVYKMTCEEFLQRVNPSNNSSVSEPSSFNLGLNENISTYLISSFNLDLDKNISIYFLYDYDKRYSRQLSPILDTLIEQKLTDMKIRCFVIVRDEGIVNSTRSNIEGFEQL